MNRSRIYRLGRFLVIIFFMVQTLGCGDSGRAKTTLVAMDLKNPMDLVIDRNGSLLVAEPSMDRIISIDQGGNKRLLVRGIPAPVGLALGPDHGVYVCSCNQGTVHLVGKTGSVSMVAEGLKCPSGLCVDRAGNLLVAETGTGRILSIRDHGQITVLASGLKDPQDIRCHEQGFAVCCEGCVMILDESGNRLSTQEIWSAQCMTHCPNGDVLMVNGMTGDICKIHGNGRIETCAKNIIYGPTGLAADRDGNLFACTWNGEIYKIAMNKPETSRPPK